MIVSGIDMTSIQVQWFNYNSGHLVFSTRVVTPWLNKQTRYCLKMIIMHIVSSSGGINFFSFHRCAFISNSFFTCVDGLTLTIYTLPLANNSTSFQQTSLMASSFNILDKCVF